MFSPGFLFDRHIVNTILGPGNKMTYSTNSNIFPFCDSLNALYCLFFQPIQASFMCLTAVLRFVESVRTLPKPVKKRVQHLEYDFKNLKQ